MRGRTVWCCEGTYRVVYCGDAQSSVVRNAADHT